MVVSLSKSSGAAVPGSPGQGRRGTIDLGGGRPEALSPRSRRLPPRTRRRPFDTIRGHGRRGRTIAVASPPRRASSRRRRRYRPRVPPPAALPTSEVSVPGTPSPRRPAPPEPSVPRPSRLDGTRPDLPQRTRAGGSWRGPRTTGRASRAYEHRIPSPGSPWMWICAHHALEPDGRAAGGPLRGQPR